MTLPRFSNCRLDWTGCTRRPQAPMIMLKGGAFYCGHCREWIADGVCDGYVITCRGEALEWRHRGLDLIVHTCGSRAVAEAVTEALQLTGATS